MRRASLLPWGIAAGLAVVGAIWFCSHEHPPAGAPAPDPASAAAAAAPEAAPPLPAAAPAAEPLPAPAGTIRRRPAAPATVDWPTVPEAAKVADLGPALARPIYDALRSAREQMDGCFEEERRREARRPVPAATGRDSADSSTVLVLRLESRPGALDVVDSELESRGDASAELVACCRIVLRGWPIPAPAATPGERYRLKYLLQ